ncbi:nuclear transport factor 2 family protein [Emcibacter sp. SYSU 3D8]|uniref:nuclear transport factor 2 family protein n=1 Tax=Emcibacter sp. SYSU 3D8 TaxID=3133969 RepID=UPI0031FEEA23
MPTELEDRMEIQHLAQVYADGVMQRDVELWGNTFSKDGAWALPGMEKPLQGHDVLKPTWSRIMEGYPHVLHFVQPGVITINGDTAKARFYVQENIKDAKGEMSRTVGVYNDDLVRENGKWKFKFRKFDVLYRGPYDLTGNFMDYPKG